LIASTAALAAALALAASGAPAAVDSAGGIKYVTEGSVIAASKSKTLTAKCPKGTHVISGGERNGEGYDGARLLQSYPLDGSDADDKPDDGWRTRVENRGSGKIHVKTQAFCGKVKTKYTSVRFTATGSSETGEETSSCPPNTFVWSGGFAAPNNAKLVLNSTFPSGNQEWGIYVDNPKPVPEDNAAVFAVCGEVEPDYPTSSAPNVNTQVRIVQACPQGDFAYSGGMGTTAGYEAAAISDLAQKPASGKPGRKVLGVFNNLITQHLFTLYAVCGPPLQ
jgi:hypothetical protein